MFTLLVKAFLAQTGRTLILALAVFVILFTFILFLLELNGWQFGLIGLSCLFILSLRDILDAFFQRKKILPLAASCPASETPDTQSSATAVQPPAPDIRQTLATAVYLTATSPDARRAAAQSVADGASTVKTALISLLVKKYALPDTLKSGLETQTATADALALYTDSKAVAAFYLDVLKMLTAVQSAANTTSLPPSTVS